MQNHYVEIGPDGRAVRWSSSPIGDADVLLPRQFDPLRHYHTGLSWMPLPECPGPWAQFDPAAGAWFDPRPAAAALAEAQEEAIAQINTAIGKERQKYITTLPGQEMIYLVKEREAEAYWTLYGDGQTPEPASPADDYPFLAKEVGITAPTMMQLVQVILFMADQWRVIGPALEEIRLGYIAQVEAATTIQSVEDAIAAFEANTTTT